MALNFSSVLYKPPPLNLIWIPNMHSHPTCSTPHGTNTKLQISLYLLFTSLFIPLFILLLHLSSVNNKYFTGAAARRGWDEARARDNRSTRGFFMLCLRLLMHADRSLNLYRPHVVLLPSLCFHPPWLFIKRRVLSGTTLNIVSLLSELWRPQSSSNLVTSVFAAVHLLASRQSVRTTLPLLFGG